MDDEAATVSQEELVFQDIPHSAKLSSAAEASDGKNVQTHTFTNFPNPEDSDEDDKADLLEGKKKAPSFWTFEYYQTFFDVDSRQVLDRILWSMYPNPNTNYLQTKIRPNPDLYGPFWICTTLVFSVAIAGNLANYLYDHSNDKTHVWKYDFHKVTLASAAIFVYWWLMPTLLYGLLWWRGNQAGYLFSEIICIYGYSLAIYIPISILWVFPFYWLQWLLVMLGMALSGTVLVFTLWPSIRHDKKQVSFGAMAAVMLMHGLLAVGFMLFFFHGSVDTSPLTTPASDNATLTTTTTPSSPHSSTIFSVSPSTSRL